MPRFICVESTIADLHTVGPKYKKIVDWCIRVIEAQPVVDVAPVRHGRWLDAEYEHVNTGEIRLGRRCSECGAGYFRYDVSVNTVSDIPRYCPNCGAKMDGGDGK